MICGNEIQPGLQIVKKLVMPLGLFQQTSILAVLEHLNHKLLSLPSYGVTGKEIHITKQGTQKFSQLLKNSIYADDHFFWVLTV